MNNLAHFLGTAVIIIGGVVGVQFLMFIYERDHLDYFHDGILFQALGLITLGTILIVLVNLCEALNRYFRREAKREND